MEGDEECEMAHQDLAILLELKKIQAELGEVQDHLNRACAQTSDVMTDKPVQDTHHSNPEDVTSSMTFNGTDNGQPLPPQDNLKDISLGSISTELVEADGDQTPLPSFVKPRTFDRSSTLFSEDQPHLSQSLMYPVRVSSPLKQSYIPETISESDEDEFDEYDDNFRSITVQNFADSSILTPINKQPREAMVFADSELLEVAEEQDEEEDETEESDDALNQERRESLFDPINHLRELFYAQTLENGIIQEQPELEDEDPQDSTAGKSLAEKSPTEESAVRDVDVDQQSMQRSVDSMSTTTSSSVRFAPDAELRRSRAPPLALISADMRKLRNAAQRMQAYVSKTELLAQEDTGISKWISLNMGAEPPAPLKNFKKTTSTSTSSTTSTSSRLNEYSGDSASSPLHSSPSLSSRTSLDIASQTSSIRTRPIPIPNSSRPKTSLLSSLGRRSSMNKSSRPTNTFLLSPVMNQPVANASAGALLSGPSQSPPAPETPKRQRRFSFQTVTSLSTKFSLGSQTPPSPVSASPTLPALAATVKTGNGAALGTLVEVDDHALNKLCDVLPLVDREVLARYLQLAGGRDDLMAVSLYMKDFKGGKIVG